MRIIKLGEKTKEKITTCHECKTEFSYFLHEIKTNVGFGTESGWINCPACDYNVKLWKNFI